MSDENIKRWSETITPIDSTKEWTVKSGGSFDMLDVQPIPDEMIAELSQMFHYTGTPWNCRSMPLSDKDREYMYLLHLSMQGFVSRIRKTDKHVSDLAMLVSRLCYHLRKLEPANDLVFKAMQYLQSNSLTDSPMRAMRKEGYDRRTDAGRKSDASTIAEVSAAFNVPEELLEALSTDEVHDEEDH